MGDVTQRGIIGVAGETQTLPPGAQSNKEGHRELGRIGVNSASVPSSPE